MSTSPLVRRRHVPALAALPLAVLMAAPAAAQSGWQQPPQPIARILDAEPAPTALVSPTRAALLLAEREALEPISWVARPFLGLGGERVDALTNAPARERTYKGLRVRAIGGGEERRLQTPAGVRLAFPRWSDDARRVAFVALTDSGSTLWVADVATGASRRVGAVTLSAAAGAPCEWMDAERLLCRTVPAGRGAAPQEPTIPDGPVTREATAGKVQPAPTYQDLLASPLDERRFDHFFTTQLAVVGVDGAVRTLGAPGVHVAAHASPDGKYVLVETLRRPYSYNVPFNNFPRTTAVWDAASGRAVKTIGERALQEVSMFASDAVLPGPRAVSWRPDAPATLAWVEALDGGDPRVKAEKRDRVLLLDAPFAAAPRPLAELGYHLAGITWMRPDLAVVTEAWRRTRRERSWAVDPSKPDAAPRLIDDRSSEDRYADPGDFVRASPGDDEGRSFRALVSPDGRYAYRAGLGASSEGDRPFLDRVDLATFRAERLWRSQAPHYEEVVTVATPAGDRIVTRRESLTEVPNYWVRDLVKKVAPRQLTAFADPAPEFAKVTKQLITYPRADGVQLSGTLYLPAGYDAKKDGPLPFLFWAYPREFKTAAAAAQVQGSPYRFTRPSGESHLFVLTQGYGVLDGPAMPVVGEGDKEPNDTYVEQLVASAKAAVDKVVAMGVADRDRIAVGGHSYGAFMTANLLAHSTLFRAGIARDGAYNRSLTPFGFQDEARSYWQAQPLYLAMSPFNFADKIKAPLLLTHGAMDDNTGTFPIQSERMFAAIKGNGGIVRWVQLPNEAHHARSRENIGHLQWEQVRWLDTYVKPKKSTASATR